MSLPVFDPWKSLSDTEGRAYRAYRAYPAAQLSTSGTLGTHAGPEFHELRTGDGNHCQTMATLARADRATIAGSCSLLVHQVHAAAIDLCRTPWHGQLERLGWDPITIFAMDVSAKTAGGLIQSLVRAKLAFATPEVAYLRIGDQFFQHERRAPLRQGLPLIWDVIGFGLPTAERPVVGNAQ